MAAPAAMAANPWVGLGVSVLGSVLGNHESAQARAQRKLMEAQIAEYKQQTAFRDQMRNSLANNASLFDPHATIANLNAQDFRNQGLEAAAIGAGAAAQGYRPGDTPTGDIQTRAAAQHREFRDNLAATLPLQFYQAKMNAYNSIQNPNGGLISSAANINQSIPQSGGYGNLLQSSLPFLGQMGKKPMATPGFAGSVGHDLTANFAPYESSSSYKLPKFDLKF